MSTNSTHPATWEIDALLTECETRRQRRSGPGGQHRNKVETGIFLKHLPTGVEASATEKRSQEANRQVAIARMRLQLAVNVRHEPDATGPSADLWSSRLRGTSIQCSANHDDFPALVAHALDWLRAENWDSAATAQKLGCTGSQLLKLLKKHAPAFKMLNQQREAAGLPRLK